MPEDHLLTANATALMYQLAPCVQTETAVEEFDSIGARIAALRLTPDEWAVFHRNHRPPQEWFDDDDVPFER